MTVQAWPTAAEFIPDTFRFSAATSKTAFAAAYTGQVQSISNAADRLRAVLNLPPCYEPGAGQREAFFMALASSGDWVSLWNMARPIPKGTLRGTPTLQAAAVPGVRSISVQTTAGATLLAGDVLGGPSQLFICAYGGAVADGSGLMTMPLVLPVRKAVTATTALAWNKPTGTFQVTTIQPELVYMPGRAGNAMQSAIELTFSEVY